MAGWWRPVGLVLFVATASCMAAPPRTVGFWFEPVTYGDGEPMTGRLGGPLTPAELTTIEDVARQELARAFHGLPLTFSSSRTATYRVRVVQELRNVYAPRYPGPAGETRAIPGIGGQSAINFRTLVSSAVVYAPAGADRAALVAAIGRGVGRTAVHELTHQLLGSRMVDQRGDRESYEFASADRREQFYGTLHWGGAWPVLAERFGLDAD